MSLGVQGVGGSEFYSLFNAHHWNRFVAHIGYTDQKNANTMTADYTRSDGTQHLYLSASDTWTVVSYSSSVSCSENGITLVNPTTLTLDGTADVTSLKSKYFKITNKGNNINSGFNTSNVYYADSSATSYATTGSVTHYTISKDSLYVVSSVPYNYHDSSPDMDVSDINSTAYPNPSGYVGGYYYEYKGRIVDKLTIDIPQIEWGAYVGTGTYGPDSPCSITFLHPPKYIGVIGGKRATAEYIETAGTYFNRLIPTDLIGTSYTQGLEPIDDANGTAVVRAGYIKKSEDGKTFTWYNSYNSSANEYQLNITNCTYYYFGIS